MSVILDFPDDPAAVGNIYVAPNGVTYYYDGVKWIGENSVNTLNDRITAGDKNLIINTDGNITFPSGGLITGDQNNINLKAGQAGWSALLSNDGNNSFWVDNVGAHVTTDFANSGNYWTFGVDGSLTLPNGGKFGNPYGDGAVNLSGNQNLYAGLASYDNNSWVGVVDASYPSGSGISPGGGFFVQTDISGATNTWAFDNDGNLTLPSNRTIRSQPSSNISINSDQYADIEWLNLAIFDPNTSNADNLNAGDTIGSLVGVDQDGAYFSVIVADTDGATSATFNTWGVNTDGNLFTERFTTGDGGTTELPPGDIIDFEGNSLVYVPTTNTAPPHDHNGLLWFNTEDGRAYIRYNHQWVDANPPVVAPASAYLDGLVIEGQTISSIDYVESAVKIGGDLVPDEDLTYNLGSPTKQWKHLYVDSHTIYMGGKALSLTNQGLEVDGRTAIYEIDGGVASTWLTV